MSGDVTEILTKAWKAVQDAQIPEALQELALSRAIDLLSGAFEPPVPSARTGNGDSVGGVTANTDSSQSAGSDEQTLYEQMSAGTGVPVDQLEKLVHLENGAPRIYLKKNDLPRKAAAAQKAITLILVVASYYLTGEEEVDLAAAREECKDFGVLDRNYSANIDTLPDFKATGPRGGNKKVRVRRALLHTFKDELVKLGLPVA